MVSNIITRSMAVAAALSLAACTEKIPQDNNQPVTPPEEVTVVLPSEAVVGEPLPVWQKGWLDIHSINGGRGESFFYIFPDGTTMLVDAAGAANNEVTGDTGIDSRPGPMFSSGWVINKYLSHFLPAVSEGGLDYFMASHYHSDHIGQWRKDYNDFNWATVNSDGVRVYVHNLSNGGFMLNGVAEVGITFPIKKIIDRGPLEDRASNLYSATSINANYHNYLNFIDWSSRANHTVRETFKVGRNDQIVPVHDAASYPSFSIRAIAGAGNIWTGSGTSVKTDYVPSREELLEHAFSSDWDVNENIFSLVFVLSYGAFDYFSGGDIQYSDNGKYSWKHIEAPISKVVGKVEVMKACHHTSSDCNSSALLKALCPDVFVDGVWTKNQPNLATLQRVFAASPDVRIFLTNLAQSRIDGLKASGIETSRFAGVGGHVVVRVAPGGSEFWVFMVDDSNFDYCVSSIHGPFPCK